LRLRMMKIVAPTAKPTPIKPPTTPPAIAPIGAPPLELTTAAEFPDGSGMNTAAAPNMRRPFAAREVCTAVMETAVLGAAMVTGMMMLPNTKADTVTMLAVTP